MRDSTMLQTSPNSLMKFHGGLCNSSSSVSAVAVNLFVKPPARHPDAEVERESDQETIKKVYRTRGLPNTANRHLRTSTFQNQARSTGTPHERASSEHFFSKCHAGSRDQNLHMSNLFMKQYNLKSRMPGGPWTHQLMTQLLVDSQARLFKAGPF